ncbi:MAG: hypothetical protein IPM85_14380 [Chitinophagaceae bacterium]|nr:hypothetical protein [Chitinophagaceae bacterium]
MLHSEKGFLGRLKKKVFTGNADVRWGVRLLCGKETGKQTESVKLLDTMQPGY